MEKSITVKNLVKVYKTGSNQSVTALNGVSFSLPEKGMVFVLGKSGCGKSTLLNILGGLDHPTDGEVFIGGEKIDYSVESHLDAYRNEDVGFIFQDNNLLEDFNIKDNIKMSLTARNISVTDAEIDRVLKKVGLENVSEKMPKELSGGQKQRVSIARALIKKPKIMLADEPTGNLDSENSARIFGLLKKLSETNLVLIVTHDLDSAYVYGDRIIELKDGSIVKDVEKVEEFDLEKVKENYEKAVNRSFIRHIDGNSAKEEKRASSRKPHPGLSTKNAFHITLTWLKHGTASVIVAVLLLSVALAGFGVINTLSLFNYDTALYNSLSDTQTQTLMLVKGKINEENFSVDVKNEAFTYSELDALREKYSNVYKHIPLSYTFEKFQNVATSAYDNRINGVCESNAFTDEKTLKNFYGAKLIAGDYPKVSDQRIELLISDRLADSILFFGTTLGDETVYPNSSYSSLVGKDFSDGAIEYRIAGIYTCRYSDLIKDKNDNFAAEIEKSKKADLNFAKNYVYQVALAAENAIKTYATNSYVLQLTVDFKSEDDDVFFSYDVFFAGAEKKSEISAMALKYRSSVVFAENYDDSRIADECMVISYGKYLEIFDRYEFDGDGNLKSKFSDLKPSDINDLKLTEKISDTETKTYVVAGVYNDTANIPDVIFVSPATKAEYIKRCVVISAIYVGTDGNDVKNVIKYGKDNDIILNSPATEKLITFYGVFIAVKDTLDLALVVLLIFVTALMFAVIAKNVGERKKDIGILRSLGANGKDVTKIFLIYDAFYIISSSITSLALYFVANKIVNAILCNGFNATFSLLATNPLSLTFMFLLCLVVITVSSLIPIIRYTKMAPISVIRNTDDN